MTGEKVAKSAIYSVLKKRYLAAPRVMAWVAGVDERDTTRGRHPPLAHEAQP
ncbi:hypothetical protein [Myxococcus sp. SDU36]|uniref:hypothetical protein n=1 Tax=Myxococcus sp. SDU36 TaxID=2831967 RepID=UPI002543753E|nr:hypothetical protein [Myxococcus sp. SDU36]WIG95467.1 hypothetical protein KGD87_34080 [Myxococcus sp. SDU36]